MSNLEDAAHAEGPHETIVQADAHHAAGSADGRRPPMRTIVASQRITSQLPDPASDVYLLLGGVRGSAN